MTPAELALGERMVAAIAEAELAHPLDDVRVVIRVLCSTLAAAANNSVLDVPLDDRSIRFRQELLEFFGFAQLSIAEGMMAMLGRGPVGQPGDGEDPEEWLARSLGKEAGDAF